MTRTEIMRRFEYVMPTPERVELHNQLRKATINLALTIQEICPESREQALALIALQEALFWGNAAIATNIKD